MFSYFVQSKVNVFTAVHQYSLFPNDFVSLHDSIGTVLRAHLVKKPEVGP